MKFYKQTIEFVDGVATPNDVSFYPDLARSDGRMWLQIAGPVVSTGNIVSDISHFFTPGFSVISPRGMDNAPYNLSLGAANTHLLFPAAYRLRFANLSADSGYTGSVQLILYVPENR